MQERRFCEDCGAELKRVIVPADLFQLPCPPEMGPLHSLKYPKHDVTTGTRIKVVARKCPRWGGFFGGADHDYTCTGDLRDAHGRRFGEAALETILGKDSVALKFTLKAYALGEERA